MTTKPFAEALKEILEEREWSQRQLAKETQARSGRLSSATISYFTQGELQPTLEAMDIIATALAINPEHFAEYRLELARDSLDWRKHGVKSALRALGE